MRKIKSFLSVIGLMLILLICYPTIVKAQDEVPEYFQPVVLELEQHYQDILDFNPDALQGTQYLRNLLQDNFYGPAVELKYALHDWNQNGTPELYIGFNDEGGRGVLSYIFTYDGTEVHNLEGTPVVFANRGNLYFRSDGLINAFFSGSHAGGNSLVQFDNQDNPVQLSSHNYIFLDGRNFQNTETGEPVTEEEYDAIYSPEGEEGVDIHQNFNWTILGSNGDVADTSGNQEQSSDTNQLDNAEGLMEDSTAYLQKLRELNENWLQVYNDHQAKGTWTFDEVLALPSENYSLSRGYHPIVESLQTVLNTTLNEMANAPRGSNYIPESRHLYSILMDTFVIEKRLAPELNKVSNEAINQLRLRAFDALRDYNYQEYQLTGILSYEFLENFLASYNQEMTAVIELDDVSFDHFNRIAISDGMAVEMIGYMNSVDYMPSNELLDSQLNYPINEYQNYIMRTNKLAQDISAVRLYYLHIPTGEMIYMPLGNYSPNPLEEPDYADIYGVDIANHYPEYQAINSNTNHQSMSESGSFSAEALASFMQSWGVEMGQVYQSYTPEQPVDFYGAVIPQQEFKIVVDGQEYQVIYGESSSDQIISDNHLYVDAVYSDISDTVNPSSERHLYLFVVGPGQPRVLISMTAPDDQGYLHFSDTANMALYNGFLNMIN